MLSARAGVTQKGAVTRESPSSIERQIDLKKPVFIEMIFYQLINYFAVIVIPNPARRDEES
jgi:hypothetical protein